MSTFKLIFVLCFLFQQTGKISSLKINKNTIEMLNQGLKALVSIKRLFSTLKSVNELTGQAFPAFANSPKMRLVNKLFGSAGKGGLVETVTGTMQAKRNPSLGLIKIGEKPPPGLFPETLPYSLTSGANQGSSNSAEILTSASPLLTTADLFSKLTSNSNSNSNSHSQGGASNGGGSTSQLISHFSPNDLKTSASIIVGSKHQERPRALAYGFNKVSSANVFNNNNNEASFEGSYEVLPSLH